MRHTLTLVDGTLVEGLPLFIASVLFDPRTAKLEAKVCLHTQFDLERAVPVRIDVTEGISHGEADERTVPAKALESGRCYMKDRGYAKFKLFNAIVAAGSSYVCRLRDNSSYEIDEQRLLPWAAVTIPHETQLIATKGLSGEDRIRTCGAVSHPPI